MKFIITLFLIGLLNVTSGFSQTGNLDLKNDCLSESLTFRVSKVKKHKCLVLKNTLKENIHFEEKIESYNRLSELNNKYTKTYSVFYKYHDTLVFTLSSIYDKPKWIDEEENTSLKFTLIATDIFENKIIEILDSKLNAQLHSFSIWHYDIYQELKGNIEVLKIKHKKIKLHLRVSYLNPRDNTRYVFFDNKITFKLNKKNPKKKRVEYSW